MRDFILFHVNGIEHRVTGEDALATLATVLRGRLGLVGAKLACSEGGCGACSVLVGRPNAGRLEYELVNSCIFFVHQADGAHVVTVEGLADAETLSGIQQAIVDRHGIQCGFCTPGFALAVTGLLEAERLRSPGRTSPFTRAELRRSLGGNLCRCTGYLQLLEAGASLSPGKIPPMADRYPDAPLARVLEMSVDDEVRITVGGGDGRRTLYMPTSITELVSLRAANPGALLIGGATNIGVEHNLGKQLAPVMISLHKVAELCEISITDDTAVVGARATWTRIARALKDVLPQCGEVLDRFGSPQIRNVGTIAGNLANASPIGDFAPLLLALAAEIKVFGSRGSRTIAIADFYSGYKQTVLEDDEVILEIAIPLPDRSQCLRVFKVSRRRHFDLAIVNAGMFVRHAAGRVIEARIAFGGIGPRSMRLTRTEDFLSGRPFALETFSEAGRVLRNEIEPISDVRGSAEYRSMLAENLLLKFFHEVADSATPPMGPA